ncbi:MAG TPA: precorrin-6y C5,15-methyltransferase (decarboxylating) subunit CbiE [Acidimicrobiales bacterium]|jgi:precorrin-6B C5,15-methyltransferase / cobalt-precorrin-6B C5,C15-methyltransferase
MSVSVVGLHGGQWYGRDAEAALRSADLLVGAARQHADLAQAEFRGEPVDLWGKLDELVDLCVARSAQGQRVCVLASGDPGFFGIVRVLAARLGAETIAVHPAPSSVAMAFARAAMPWDDAVVATCHGRPLESSVRAVLEHPKVAVLVSRDNPPEALGRAVVDAGGDDRNVWVCSHLGEPEETIHRTDLDGLAAGTFDPLSVVLLVAPDAEVALTAGTGWGRDHATFEHRAGLITKAEVRAVVLGKLDLPPSGVLWDVGAGSGSVAVEAVELAPALRAFAVERDAEACEQIRHNARGTTVRVIEGAAPAVLAELPDPDRAFVGGGGIDVLDAVLERLRPGAAVVATYATLDAALAGADRLGSLVQVQLNRGVPIGPEGRLRLAAENPVFVVWGNP